MAPYISDPDPTQLLPPLLACLPIAFISPRPPPALLPLLSPILRQRVQLLSTDDGKTQTGWLPLLSWDAVEASELTQKVEDGTYEPHPVSGEIELGDVGIPIYRRKDEETLQALLKIPDFGLQAVYVWCEHDEAGGGPGWRLTELQLLNLSQSEGWSDSILKANKTHAERDNYFHRSSVPSLVQSGTSSDPEQVSSGGDGDDDDDDYWARYDATPGRTPAPPQPMHAMHEPSHARTTSEADYYARYAGIEHTIDDADQPQDAVDASNMAVRNLGDEFLGQGDPPKYQERESAVADDFGPACENIVHTRPSSSSSAPVVAHLEQSAQTQSQAEVAIQQHIGNSIKGLFRLAHGAGLESAEFKRIVRTELDLLEMFDHDQ